MTTRPGDGVRPTQRCLGDLGIDVPNLGVWLETLADSVVERAQLVPAMVAGGGAERILSIQDRIVFKVKTGRRRGAVTKLVEKPSWSPELQAESIPPDLGVWWLIAAGERRDDSPQHDFYARVESEYAVAGVNFLPQPWDWRRLRAELTVALVGTVHQTIRRCAYLSLVKGGIAEIQVARSVVRVVVRARDHEAYIAISGEGLYNPETFALLLSSFPEVSVDDWQPEPGGAAGMNPKHGEILWSTILPPSVAAALMDEFGVESDD